MLVKHNGNQKCALQSTKKKLKLYEIKSRQISLTLPFDTRSFNNIHT